MTPIKSEFFKIKAEVKEKTIFFEHSKKLDKEAIVCLKVETI